MRKNQLLLLSFIVVCNTITAQLKNPVGTYMLQGAREMASGYELKPDSTFEFFFSYRALDRYGKGKWKQHHLQQ